MSVAEFDLSEIILGQRPLHESSNTDCDPTFEKNISFIFLYDLYLLTAIGHNDGLTNEKFK